MSVDDPIAAQRNLFINNYIALISFVLFNYDYLLTLQQEVASYWTIRRLGWHSLFFFLNRYSALLGNVPVMLEFFWTSPFHESTTCRGLQIYHMYFSAAVEFFVGVILIMRTYALYNRSKIILLFLSTMMVSYIAFCCWAAASSQGGRNLDSTFVFTSKAGSGCLTGLPTNGAHVITALWINILILDFSVFILTLRKAVLYSRDSPSSLFRVLVRDGAIYFAVISGANFANIMTFYVASTSLKGVVTPFVNNISSIMVSRLMLNLHDPELKTPASSTMTGPPDLSMSSDLGEDIRLVSMSERIPSRAYILH